MAKAETTNAQEAALLEKYGSNTKPRGAKKQDTIPNLAINIASEDRDGKEIPVKTFHLQGMDSPYAKSVKFRPLVYVNKLIAQEQVGTNWKTVNETVFYNFGDTIYDTSGGEACGRLMGKAIPESWTEEQKKANKDKASYYGYLFGTVQFDKEAPILCNLRLTASKSVSMSNVLNEIKKKSGSIVNHALNLKLVSNPKNKASPHPALEIEPDFSVDLGATGIGEHLAVINEFIERNNARIMQLHESAKLGYSQDKQAASTVGKLNDEIPF